MPPKRKAHLAKADSNVSQAKKAAKGSKSAKPAASKEKLSNASAEPSDEKAKSPMDNYLLLVHLTNSRDPVITRLISVPSKFTFATLHEVLQVAFGWANCHEHSFAVSKLLEKGEVSPSKSSRILLSIVKGSSGVDDPAGDYFNKSTSKLT